MAQYATALSLRLHLPMTILTPLRYRALNPIPKTRTPLRAFFCLDG